MLEKIFKELFDDNFYELIKNELKDADSSDEKHSYYYKSCDKYENGKCVAHEEKEVKDGKVIKDVKETAKAIEDKTNNEVEDLKKELKEKEETIKRQEGRIHKLENMLRSISRVSRGV